MHQIPLPTTIEIVPGGTTNQSVISIRPCSPGYGTTLGNALRRVMLSSLPGAAVTAFKVKGVSHEFSSIPLVKEDAVEITLNLKQLRMKVFSDQPVRLKLKASGSKNVTAADIEPSSDVEISNKDLVIATLTDKSADLEMDLLVSQGIGFVPVETNEKEELEVDMIAIDSIFTPVRNVGFKIENVRVGQMTNFENLLLTVETDGTITPEEALQKATAILIDQFSFIQNQQGAAKSEMTVEEPVTEGEVEEVVEKKEKKTKKAKKSEEQDA